VIVHWDDVEPVRAEYGPLAGAWRDLGRAAGTQRIGLNRIEVDPGKRSTPAHLHTVEEEIYFVLAGSGLLWQDGVTCEIRANDTIVAQPGAQAHTLLAGDDGLDVLAFGTRDWPDMAYLPRARVARMGPVSVPLDTPHPWQLEADAGDLDAAPGERPPNVLALDDAPVDEESRETVAHLWRTLGRAAGSRRTGLNHVTVAPGKLGLPPHCHSADEELFVVLAGDGVCVLGDDEHPVHHGVVVSRPPGTRVPHAFRGGDSGLVYVAYGTREPVDLSWYPRSRKVFFRGLGVVARIDPAEFWDDED
jgi:uncharacterized cupin superfamily protein